MDECNEVPDAGTSMWTARLLSITVKNMQSCVVGIVWGTEAVFSLFRFMGGKWRNRNKHKLGAPKLLGKKNGVVLQVVPSRIPSVSSLYAGSVRGT